jgi:hypothetical protein
MTITQMTPQPEPSRLYDQLNSVETATRVTIHFHDGRVATGCLAFNEMLGTGRVIAPEKELSTDFEIADIRDLKFA